VGARRTGGGLLCYDPVVNDQVNKPPGGSDFGNQPIVGQFQHAPVTARVPDRVARAVYSTGQLVLDSPKEFVIDFLNGLTRPFQVVARVVLAPTTMNELALALKLNLEKYTTTFGPPPPVNPPVNPPRPSLQEIYENFKIGDDQLSGAYANSVMIGHSQTEFFFDFITGFFPTSAVSARVLVAASHVPKLLAMLNTSLQQYQARHVKRPGDPGTPPPQSSG
jgi:hypothetical protein